VLRQAEDDEWATGLRWALRAAAGASTGLHMMAFRCQTWLSALLAFMIGAVGGPVFWIVLSTAEVPWLALLAFIPASIQAYLQLHWEQGYLAGG
jgi:hypothetical protein